MKNLIILFTMFCLIASCRTQKTTTKSKIGTSEKLFELKSVDEIKKGTTIDFQFMNNSMDMVTVHNPSNKSIERFENNQWRNVRILYCPCGADCLPPPKIKVIKAGEKHVYNWNLIEGWCDKMKGNNISKTIEKNSLVGLYRTKIRYSINNNTELVEITKEFKIIN